MVTTSERAMAPSDGIVYPDSDGQPMSDNTKQFRWITLLALNLDALVGDFVAGDILWYPVEGRPKVRIGPDVLVALGRPKGDRGSYKQWEEDGVAPQLVIEVLSPSNTVAEMQTKAQFYHRHGVREFLVVDPDTERAWGFTRNDDGRFELIEDLIGWTSAVVGIGFERGDDDELVVRAPSGSRLLTFDELMAEREAERERAEAERERAEAERERAEAERERAEAAEAHAEAADARADAERQRARVLAAKLAELGVDPDTLA